MSAYFIASSGLDSIEAQAAVLPEPHGPTVVIRGYSENYPLLGVHLSPDRAARLVQQINAALAELNSEPAMTPEQEAAEANVRG